MFIGVKKKRVNNADVIAISERHISSQVSNIIS